MMLRLYLLTSLFGLSSASVRANTKSSSSPATTKKEIPSKYGDPLVDTYTTTACECKDGILFVECPPPTHNDEHAVNREILLKGYDPSPSSSTPTPQKMTRYAPLNSHSHLLSSGLPVDFLSMSRQMSKRLAGAWAVTGDCLAPGGEPTGRLLHSMFTDIVIVGSRPPSCAFLLASYGIDTATETETKTKINQTGGNLFLVDGSGCFRVNGAYALGKNAPKVNEQLVNIDWGKLSHQEAFQKIKKIVTGDNLITKFLPLPT